MTHVPLADERFPHDSVNHCVLGAQPERLLEELVISLRREDARLGLLAVTLF